jgi:hypothetical protein
MTVDGAIINHPNREISMLKEITWHLTAFEVRV